MFSLNYQEKLLLKHDFFCVLLFKEKTMRMSTFSRFGAWKHTSISDNSSNNIIDEDPNKYT